jgi:KUP system potassium uptake protein
MAYIGQAAHISRNPESYANPFFLSAPPGMFWPSQIIAILAAVVASQALITSTFQLLFQVINMSYFPPIKMVNTSQKHHSQIYIPIANWAMMVGTIVVTAVFRNVSLVRRFFSFPLLTSLQTTKLGNAYGVCVILDTVITTTLVSLVALIVWRIKWFFVLPLWLVFATFEGLYMTSALNKVPDGAWFTVSLAVVLALIFSTWRYGKERQWKAERKGRLPRLSNLVLITSRSDGAAELKLTEAFGGGEVTNVKGKPCMLWSIGCVLQRLIPTRPRRVFRQIWR